MMEQYVQEFLTERGIAYVLHAHPAVFTCEEAAVHCKDIPGLACKNLFLKDNAGKFYLLILPDDKRLDMKQFRTAVNAEKVRFGTEEELMAVLGLTPGSVSPLGVINDKEGKVTVYVDASVWGAEIVSCHPNINTETLELKQEDFRKIFRQRPRILE